MHPAPLPASLGPVLEFMRSLWSLDHALSVRSREVRERFGITVTQRLVVRILGQTPGSSAGGVAGILHVHPSTLTPVLQQLVERGLVRRAADPADRRRAVLWLTARGERIDAASASDVDDRVRRALARLAPSEVFHARRVVQALVEALGEAQQRPARRKKKPAAPRDAAVTHLRSRPRPEAPAEAHPRGAGRGAAS